MQKHMTAYTNFKKYSVRYDLEHSMFTCWYTPQELVIEDAAITKVLFGGEAFTLADYGSVSFDLSQCDDATGLTITYGNGPAQQKEFGISFLFSGKGISCTFMCRGDRVCMWAGGCTGETTWRLRPSQ